MIRTYIEQEGLPVRVTRSTPNKDLLDMIEEALENAPDKRGNGDESASDDTPASTDSSTSEETDETGEAEEEEPAPDPTPRPERQRRRR